jgi:calcium/calmodulin-dependent protein kinase I
VELKIIDFGFSKRSMFGQNDLGGFVGTPFYMAPEIINSQLYGCKVDIWSLGVVTFLLISG